MAEYPKVWLERMEKILGEEFQDFMEALNGAPVISLRTNPKKPGAVFEEGNPVPWCPEGQYLPERPKFVRDPLLHAGGYYVQEASSMLIGAAVDFEAGMKVLDLCAAPGGKSTLLSTRIGEEGLLVANEIVSSRARVLEENISRWGATNAVVTNNRSDAFSGLSNFFDLIVVDAPCSGEGMFRKDPAVIEHWSPQAVLHCAERQRDILENVLSSLRPGGKLIYSTCTFNRNENEEIVKWLVEDSGHGMQVVEWEPPADWGLTPGDVEGYFPEMAWTFHSYPHKAAGEGFFISVLEKTGSGGQSGQIRKKKKKKKRGKKEEARKQGISPQVLKEAEKWLANPKKWIIQEVEDEVWALPRHFESEISLLQERLQVFRAGIRMGRGKGKTFVPDHDLAMCNAVGTDWNSVELDYGNAIQFLKRGQVTLQDYEPQGWALATYRGLALGWMKILSNRVNIHLPRQWRIRADVSDW